jgi:hypothetical protein
MLETDVYLAGYAQVQPTISLEQNFGNAKIDVRIGGELYIDGTPQGMLNVGTTANIADLSVGDHDFEIKYGDGQSEKQSVSILKDQSIDISFSYKPEPEPVVTIKTEPKPEPLPAEEAKPEQIQTAEPGQPRQLSPLFNLGVPGITHLVSKKPIGWAYLASAIVGVGAFTFSEIYFMVQKNQMETATSADAINVSYDTMAPLRGVSIGGLALWVVSAIVATIHGAVQ